MKLKAIVLVSIVALLFILAATPVSAAQIVGNLKINSSPSGATVLLDNANKGVTPVTLGNILAGKHAVVLKKTGYNDYKTTVTVVAGQTATISATLVPVTPTTGSINITSSPSGATVLLDNANKGSTPVTLSDIAPGNHTVLLKKTGYNDYKTTVTVVAGQTATISATLVPVTPTTGSISITSSPSGATVLLDNVNKGVTPVTLNKVAPGKHTVVLKKTGYKDNQNSVTVVAGQTATVNATLSKK